MFKNNSFLGTDLQESADWLIWTNEVLNKKGNIILCEVSVCQRPISEKKDVRGWFCDKILAELPKAFNHKKSHTNLETKIILNERIS